MSDQQLADVARFCNRYPDIEMEHALQGGAGAAPGDPVTVEVTLQRAQEGDAGPVDAARYIPARSVGRCHISVQKIHRLIELSGAWCLAHLRTQHPNGASVVKRLWHEL